MSVDYYLISPSHRRGVQVGSIGFGGVQSYPGLPEVKSFIAWAIEESVRDIAMVSEDAYFDICLDVNGNELPDPLVEAEIEPSAARDCGARALL